MRHARRHEAHSSRQGRSERTRRHRSRSPVHPERDSDSDLMGCECRACPVDAHRPQQTKKCRHDAARSRRTSNGLRVICGHHARVVPVGRLDFASTGLLLFTNDTQLANWLTDPATGIVRRYVVTVRGELTDETARALEAGVVDRDEALKAATDRRPETIQAGDARHRRADGRQEPRNSQNDEVRRA